MAQVSSSNDGSCLIHQFVPGVYFFHAHHLQIEVRDPIAARTKRWGGR